MNYIGTQDVQPVEVFIRAQEIYRCSIDFEVCRTGDSSWPGSAPFIDLVIQSDTNRLKVLPTKMGSAPGVCSNQVRKLFG